MAFLSFLRAMCLFAATIQLVSCSLSSLNTNGSCSISAEGGACFSSPIHNADHNMFVNSLSSAESALLGRLEAEVTSMHTATFVKPSSDPLLAPSRSAAARIAARSHGSSGDMVAEGWNMDRSGMVLTPGSLLSAVGTSGVDDLGLF